MANDGTVKIGTELDQTGFKTGLSGLGSFASKGFGAVGKAAGVMASVTVGALAAVATGMGAAVVSGVKYNAQMENYTASFATMLGSEEAAISKVNELKKLGASTPFEMSDLAEGTTALLQYGIAADESTGILTMLGDVSLGSAEKLSGLTAAYGKVSSTGKLTGETLESMINNGFNPLNVISAQTGESMDELRERMSAGGISADEVAAAFKTATSEGGQFYKGMETASTTFDGLISTLKDNANSLVGEVVKPISDAMTKTLLPEAIGMVQTLTDAFAKDGIPGLINAAGGVVGTIISGIAEQAPAVVTMASGFLTTLLNALMAQLPALSTAGVGIVAELLTAITTNLPLLFTLGMTLLTSLITGIAAQLPALIPQVVACITSITGTIVASLPLILSAGIQILMAVINGIVSMIPTLITQALSLITTIVATLLANLPAIIAAAIQILVALVTGLTQAIPQLLAMLPTIITTIVDTLLANLGTIIQCAIQLLIAVITGLTTALPQLVAMLPQIITTIITTLLNNLPLIINCAIQLLAAIVTGLIQALPSLIASTPKIIAAIVDALKNFDWSTLGKNIIDGIKTGITNAAGALGDAAKAAAKKALDSVKSFLGIKSPSRVFAKQVGKQIPAGEAKGVDDNAYMLEDASVDSAESALKAAQAVSASGMVSQMQGQAYGRVKGLTSGSAAMVSANGGKKDDASSDIGKAVAKALDGVTVEIDGQPAGRILAHYIDDELGSMSSLKERYA